MINSEAFADIFGTFCLAVLRNLLFCFVSQIIPVCAQRTLGGARDQTGLGCMQGIS